MEIQFKSEFFKRIFNSEVFTDEMASREILSIYKDLNPLVFLDKKILEDYTMILENSPQLDSIFFSDISMRLINTFLKNGMKEKTLRVFNTTLSSILLDGVDETALESLEELFIVGCKSDEEEPIELRGIDKLKNLKRISFFNTNGLDIDSFMRNLPQRGQLERICLSNPLPSPEVMKECIGLKIIEIHNIEDSNMLKAFLEALPLENLLGLELINCNLENLSEDIILRLETLKSIRLVNNANADYNKILEALPNKDLEFLFFSAQKEKKEELDIEKLKSFSIITLNLSNFDLDYDKFKEIIDNKNVEMVLFLTNCGVENLDFLQNSKLFNIRISEKNIDFSILTPELAQKLRKINLIRESTNESIGTNLFKNTENGIISISELDLRIDDTTLPEVEHLAKCMDTISGLTVDLTTRDVSRIREFVELYGYKLEWGYNINMSDFSMLDINTVEELNREKRLQKIIVMDSTCNDSITPERYSYPPEQFLELKEIVEGITKGIDPNMPELEKFMIIYRRLGSAIKYDYGIIGNNKYSEYAKSNIDNCRNMINGLIRNTCVCAGYSDILYNCLREVGIEAYKVTGTSGTDWHQWNKVKIDGVLYNVDLTWDAENLADNCLLDLKNCLVSDTFFGLTHKGVFGNSEKCERSISRKAKREALRKALEIDGIEPKTLFGKALDELREMDILEELKKAYESFKESWRVEILPELKRLFSKEKALPPPIEKTNLDESLKEKVEETKEGETNPWVVEEEIKNKVNKISHESVNPIKNLNIIDKEVSDE